VLFGEDAAPSPGTPEAIAERLKPVGRVVLGVPAGGSSVVLRPAVPPPVTPMPARPRPRAMPGHLPLRPPAWRPQPADGDDSDGSFCRIGQLSRIANPGTRRKSTVSSCLSRRRRNSRPTNQKWVSMHRIKKCAAFGTRLPQLSSSRLRCGAVSSRRHTRIGHDPWSGASTGGRAHL
jgi:hypothetical protein